MPAAQVLFCPLRGRLEVPGTASDGLSPSEEARRIDCVNALLARRIPRENIRIEQTVQRLGHEGSNSIRADLVVLDIPTDSHSEWTTDDVLNHAWAIGEIKRDHDSAESAKEYQVKPAIRLARPRAIGIYWDGEEQTLLWQDNDKDGTTVWRESDFSTLPPLGSSPEARRVTYADLEDLMQGARRRTSLTAMFRQIEDRCHAAAISPERRSKFALQLLVGRAGDEEEGRDQPDQPLTFQDYPALGTAPPIAANQLRERIRELIEDHNAVLRIDLPSRVDVPNDVLLDCVAILSRVLISKVSTSVFQEFFMTFVKEVYRWDQAMYFTPTEVTDTVVHALNPQARHRCCDPASGVGDFLTSFLSYRLTPQAKQRVFGIDLAEHAVEISRLNLLFGGGQPTNIAHGDTLLRVAELRRTAKQP
jgi:type I restriction enzyme M protein